MKLMSSVFVSGSEIPEKYSCQGEDISPPLNWQGVPEEADRLVLLFDDPDSSEAPWSHWVLYNIPADRTDLPEGVTRDERLAWGALQGRNTFGDIGYGGPCPPVGDTHHYYFRLFAVDEPCPFGPGATRLQIFDWLQEHKIETAEMMGRFTRTSS